MKKGCASNGTNFAITEKTADRNIVKIASKELRVEVGLSIEPLSSP